MPITSRAVSRAADDGPVPLAADGGVRARDPGASVPPASSSARGLPLPLISPPSSVFGLISSAKAVVLSAACWPRQTLSLWKVAVGALVLILIVCDFRRAGADSKTAQPPGEGTILHAIEAH